MRYLLALIFFAVFNFINSQNNKVNIGSVEIIIPYVPNYNECVDEKLSKKYSELFITKSYDLLGFYINNETYKYNKLSELYDGLSDFGYLMINKDLKNEFIDNEIFNHLITYTDSVY